MWPQSMFDTDTAVKDFKIVCADDVVETYQAVFAWASSFFRRQSVLKLSVLVLKWSVAD